ncbi:MAG: hypothetical protein Q4E59_00785 [Bacteroidales bacterium]|nr:hypothetical protein [Bacteroidales bacterium]
MGIKFGAKQEGQFIKEIAQLLPGISLAGDAGGSTIDRSAGIWNLFYRDRKGKLDMNNEVDRYFKEFLDNGGRTGISTLSRKDEYEGSMETLMKRTTYGDWNLARRGMKGLVDQIEKANEGIENATRFAVYMVRRRNGASVAEAIFDAKEASVNFNMKGSGAWGNAYLRTFYLYSNPALQSLRMVGTWYASDPTATTGALIRHGARVGARRLTGAAALTFAASLALAWACAGWGGDDDDESAWYGLSDWQRYNYVNIPIPGGGRKFLTWSIPQEMRPVWALAQISFDHMTGRITGERAAKSALVQLNNYSPVTLVDGGVRHEPTDSYAKTFIKAWTPTIAEDVLDAYLWKEDFLGRRIGYRTENNEYSPEWQRVDDNTPKWLVELSRGWNNLTGGRNNRRSGWVNEAFNPSAIWFIAEQQGGGFYDIIKKFAVCADMVLSGEADEIELRDTPFASALMVDAGTDQSRQRVVNDRYWMLRGEYETAKHEIQLIRREQREGSRSPEEIAKDISAMYEDGSFTNWEVFNSYEKDYKRLRKYADAAEESGDKAALKHWNSLIFDMKRIVLKDIEKRDALRSGEDATGLNAELEAMKSDFRTKVESWKQGD